MFAHKSRGARRYVLGRTEVEEQRHRCRTFAWPNFIHQGWVLTAGPGDFGAASSLFSIIEPHASDGGKGQDSGDLVIPGEGCCIGTQPPSSASLHADTSEGRNTQQSAESDVFTLLTDFNGQKARNGWRTGDAGGGRKLFSPFSALNRWTCNGNGNW